MLYDPVLVAPMREEVVDLGFEELTTAEEVHDALRAQKGTALVFVNSVCGCSAGGARPGIRMALATSAKKPAKLYTVFAGQEPEATNAARSYFVGYAPSSPSMGLLKDGELVHMIERHQIEGQLPESIARNLVWAFDKYC